MSWLHIVRHRAERTTEEARAKIVSCDDADDVYGKGLRSTLAITLLYILSAWFFFAVSAFALGVVFAALAVSSAMAAAQLEDKSMLRRSAYEHWYRDDSGIVIRPSWHLLAYDWFATTISIVGIGVGAVLPWFIPQERIGGVGSSAVALLILHAVISGLSRRPFGLPTGPAIILSCNGIHLLPGQRYEAWIPWNERPREAGVQNGTLLITTRDRYTIIFPVSYLYPGCAQISRVLEFYSTHASLRHELAKPEGLERVKFLMQHTVQEVEQQLPPPAPRRPRRHRK
ncbi:hypothetical protein [Actinomyces glycerinitolerans]|uniref:Uncharacterized protein n=1 Tax=Actinomyces glycerinitolerans TaxID=1892869 RepID=A0A1M4RWV7_9ACTO|nr:hypothetical protein [Actinomyces glycerinitolerans]SHE24465.1 Hypothetical protein ACGLYG10_0666 [Actinomyces glycerinitolerans]